MFFFFLKGGSKNFEFVMTSLSNVKTPEEFDAEDGILLAAYDAQTPKAFIAIGNSNSVHTDDFINLDDKLVEDEMTMLTQRQRCCLAP
jgi:hypothetical protein